MEEKKARIHQEKERKRRLIQRKTDGSRNHNITSTGGHTRYYSLNGKFETVKVSTMMTLE